MTVAEVCVTARDGRGDPVRAVVMVAGAPIAVACRKHVSGWEALYGVRVKTGAQEELPHCFELNNDCLTALELAR